MKTSRFFLIFAALLALLFLFPGCETGTTPPQDTEEEPPPDPITGTEYVFLRSTNIYTFLSIYGGELRTPETGDSFEIWEMELKKDADDEYLADSGSNPRSYGTISVSGSTITFKDDAGAETGSGTIGEDNSINMTKIPGVVYAGTMKVNRTVAASGNAPFGTGGPMKPQDSTNTPSPQDTTAVAFDSEKIVATIELAKDDKGITIYPTFTAQSGSGTAASPYVYKEGYPAQPKTIAVKITWDDGTTSTNTNPNDFIAIPYCFKVGTPERDGKAVNKIYYIGDGATFSKEIDEVKDASAEMPDLKAIKGIQVNPKDSAGKAIMDKTNPTQPMDPLDILDNFSTKQAFHEDQLLFSVSGYPLQWSHETGAWENIPTNLLFPGTLPLGTPAPNKLNLEIGSKEFKNIPIKEVFTVKSVKHTTEQPDLGQVLFDDPRLLKATDTQSIDDIDYKQHWFRRLRDLKLTVSYSGAGDQTRGIEYFRHNSEFVIRDDDSDFPDIAGGKPFFGIRYYGEPEAVPLSIPVTVYSQLRDIEVTPRTSGTIIMRGSSNTGKRDMDTEGSFIRQLADISGVSAIYQTSGSISTAKKVRRPLLIKAADVPETAKDAQSFLNNKVKVGTLPPNLSADATLTTNIDSLLTNANSKQYEERGRTRDVRITFTTLGGTSRTSDAVKIGVMDEWGK